MLRGYRASGLVLLLALTTETVAGGQAVPDGSENAVAIKQTIAPVETPPADPAPPTCELHVWPGDALKSIFYGWVRGGAVDGAIKGRKGYPALPPSPLDTSRQLELLKTSSPNETIGRPSYVVIFHQEALPSRVIRSSTARIIASDSPCYAELIVDDVMVNQGVFSGSRLTSLFRFRDFANDATPQRTFGTLVKTEMKLFPPEQESGLAVGLAELSDAYVQNVRLFGKALIADSAKNSPKH